MRLGKYMMAAAAATMSVTPAIAAPASPVSASSSVGAQRAGSQVNDASDLAGGGGFVAIIAAIVVIVGIILVAKNNDTPKSP